MIDIIVNIVVYGSVVMLGLSISFLYAYSKTYSNRSKQ